MEIAGFGGLNFYFYFLIILSELIVKCVPNRVWETACANQHPHVGTMVLNPKIHLNYL
jgi:hypothetical protein